MPAPLILVDASPRNAADGTVVPFRVAGGGGELPYPQGYRGGIVQLPKFVASLDFDEDSFGTGGVATASVIEWAASVSDLAAAAGLVWEDAAVTVRIGPEGGQPPIALQGKVMKASAGDGRLQIAFADPAVGLKKSFLRDRFEGTGGLEGPVDWTGTIKRRVFGRVWNLPGSPIDPANNIYCFADPLRQINAFAAVRDKGAVTQQLDQLAWQGTPEATLAALQAADAPEGGGIACPSIACVKWWTQPAGELTADLKGETAGGYVESTPGIVSRVVSAVSGPAFAAGTLDTAYAARPAPIGLVVENEGTTASQILDQLLGNVSLLWVLTPTGEIVLREWKWGPPTRRVKAYSIGRSRTFRPLAARRTGYRLNQLPMARNSLAAIVLVKDLEIPPEQFLNSEQQWRDILDDDGTRPEDNATVGAPDWSPVGDRTAGEVTEAIDQNNADWIVQDARNINVDEEISAARQDIADLFETYGFTASAADSAAIAKQVEDIVLQAKGAVEGYVGEVEEDRLAVENAKGDTLQYRNAAVAARDGAQGFEAGAATQAGLSAVARNAAEAAQAATAKRLADQLPKRMPDAIGTGFYTTNLDAGHGYPNMAPTDGTRPQTFNKPNFGWVWKPTTLTRLGHTSKGPMLAGRVYKLTVSGEIKNFSGSPADLSANLYAYSKTISGSTYEAVAAAGGTKTFTGNGRFSLGPFYISREAGLPGVVSAPSGELLGMFLRYNGPQGLLELEIADVEDVTGQFMADASATASAQNATFAEASNNEAEGFAASAGQQASLAVEAKNTATSKADIATAQAVIATEKAAQASQNMSLTVQYRDTTLNYRDATEAFKNTATSKADIATAQAVIATEKAAQASQNTSLTVQYRDATLGYRNETEGFKNTASSKADIAAAQTAIATEKAAAATASASVAANVGQRSINANPGFDDFPSSALGARPTGYNYALTGLDSGYRVNDAQGGYAWRLPSPANATTIAGMDYRNTKQIKGGEWVVVECEIQLNAGNLNGAGVLLREANGSSTVRDNTISFSSEIGLGTVGEIYRVSKILQTLPATNGYILFVSSHWPGFAGSMAAANDITFLKALIRPATQAEIDTKTVLPDLQASVTINQAAIAGLENTAAVYEVLVEAANGNPAAVRLLAGKNGSAIDLVSDSVRIRNKVDGSLLDVATFENGIARLNGALIRNLAVAPTPQSQIFHEVQLRPLIFLAKDGDVVKYQGGESYNANPDRIEFDVSGLPALSPGEAYDIKATNITGSQFELHSKKLGAAQAIARESQPGTDRGGSVNPRYQTDKPSAEDAKDFYYQFTITVTIPKVSEDYSYEDIGSGEYQYRAIYSGGVTMKGKRASDGQWVTLGTATFTAERNAVRSSPGPSPNPAYVTVTMVKTPQSSEDLGQGNDHFGVHPASGTTVSPGFKVAYSTQTSSTVTAVTSLVKCIVHPPLTS